MNPRRTDHRTLGILGASGGLGTSTLAAATAVVAAAGDRSVLLVDLHPCGGGVDAHLGTAHTRGRRWPGQPAAMRSLRLAHLPTVAGVHVLGHRLGRRPGVAPGAAALTTVASLARQVDLTVLDLPGGEHPRALAWWHLCDVVVLLAGAQVPQVAAALALQALAPPARAVVVRPGRAAAIGTHDVAAVLGLPLLTDLDQDATVVHSQLAEQPPGLQEGPVRGAAAAVLAFALDTGTARPYPARPAG